MVSSPVIVKNTVTDESMHGYSRRALGLAHPQPHYMNAPDIYSPFRAGQGPVAIRYTLVVSTPNLFGLGSAEMRVSYTCQL
jgi:hypothetical protein